ncbi:MAG: tetratricopeptide repeat protein [Nitrospirae bacterium]|nr:tetratricopeptide repeat protein [Nitrospirota bacterium]
MAAQVSLELLDRFSNYVSSRMGLHFPKERLNDLERGTRKACRELGHEDVEECIRWLMLSPVKKSHIEILASHLTVGETYFFRDRKSFDILEGDILSGLIRKRAASGRYLRIWSAGCASGEEPYSIAILLSRLIPDFADWNITILGTDVNLSFLSKASKGVYSEWSFREVPSWIKDRYFRKTREGLFEILPEIRKHVTFSYLNLAEDAYPSLTNNTNAMDIIFCRNVLMYFSRDHQTAVGRKLYRCLVDGGWLIVSMAEISSELFSPFVQVDYQGSTLYRKDVKRAFECTIAEMTAPCVTVIEEPVAETPEPETVVRQEAPRPVEKTAPPCGPYDEALALYKGCCYKEAEDKLAPLLSDENESVRAMALLTHVYADQGRLDDALDLCRKAVSRDKLNPRLYYLMAIIQHEKGLAEESRTSLKRALYLDQNFALAHFSLGNLARTQGKIRESEKHFGNALSILKTCREDEIVPESEGITAGRLSEIIRMNMKKTR